MSEVSCWWSIPRTRRPAPPVGSGYRTPDWNGWPTSGVSRLKRDQIAERGARMARRDERATRDTPLRADSQEHVHGGGAEQEVGCPGRERGDQHATGPEGG